MSLNTILATAPLTATGYHLKATGTALGQSLIWDNGTNVGIGNTNTSYTLDVSGSLRSTTSAYFATASGSVGIGTVSPSDKFSVDAGAGNVVTSSFFNSTMTAGQSSYIEIGKNYSSTYNTGELAFKYVGDGSSSNIVSLGFYGAGNKLNVLGNGNVGIGTSSPSSLLHLSSSSGNTAQTITTTGAGSYGVVGFLNTTTGYGYDIGFGGSTTIAPNSFYIYGGSSASLKFVINSSGAVTIAGSLSKGSGSFRIDHPLESMTKTHQLVHSFIEGPQADLIYRGKLTLVNGKAQANIDEVSTMSEGTFEVLCRDIQCFTTNESGWDLVKGKVIGNVIYIDSQNPNSTDEISWMVIGERKDKHMMDTEWTDDNGKVIVEPLKPIEPIVATN